MREAKRYAEKWSWLRACAWKARRQIKHASNGKLNEPQQWEAASEENFRSFYTSITADGLKAQICRNRNSDRSLFPGNQTSNHETDIPSV